MKQFGEFVKTASDKLGRDLKVVSVEKANDAYELYTKITTEKTASILPNLYEVIDSGESKIALDMVSVNILDDAGIEKDAAGPIPGLLAKGRGMLGGDVGNTLKDLAVWTVGGEAMNWGMEKAKDIYHGVKNKIVGKKRPPRDYRLNSYTNTY